MYELKKNHPREKGDMKCPICNQKEDITEQQSIKECQIRLSNSRNSIQNKR